MVKQYKGAYSGEHGDGLVRSEWIAPFFGPRLTACLGEIKSWLDPKGLMNPGKIVNPSKMDDARLFRFPPGYAAKAPVAVLDWSRVGRRRQGRRDVQQQRPLPQVRRRHHVPVLPRHRATKRTSRAGEPTPCASRSRASSAPNADADGEAGARPVRVVQGLQARVPDRRRHGAHEDRVHRALQGAARPDAARPRRRLPAALRAVGRAPGARRQPCLAPGCGRALGFSTRRELPAWRQRLLRRPGMARSAAVARWCCWWTRSTATSSRRTRAPRCACSRPPAIACTSAQPLIGDAAPVLRPHVPVRRPRAGGQARGAARARCARPVDRQRRAGRRARAVLPVHAARRIPGAVAGRPRRWPPMRSCSRSSSRAKPRRGAWSSS